VLTAAPGHLAGHDPGHPSDAVVYWTGAEWERANVLDQRFRHNRRTLHQNISSLFQWPAVPYVRRKIR
jgi:hypothetical protein